MGEEWAREWGWWCAATRGLGTPAQRYAAIPLEGWGPHTRPRPTMIRGAGPDHSWDAATKEMAASGPGAANRMDWRRVLAHQSTRPPPHRPSRRQCAPGYGDTHMGTRRGDHPMAPSEDGAARLAVAHFKTAGPVYDNAPSRLDDTPGVLTPHAPHRPCSRAWPGAGQLRRAASGVGGTRGQQPTGPHPPDECQWDMLEPHLTGRHVYMATPPQGHPRPAWHDLIAPFHDHRILNDDTWPEVQRKTLGRDYRCRVRACLL